MLTLRKGNGPDASRRTSPLLRRRSEPVNRSASPGSAGVSPASSVVGWTSTRRRDAGTPKASKTQRHAVAVSFGRAQPAEAGTPNHAFTLVELLLVMTLLV